MCVRAPCECANVVLNVSVNVANGAYVRASQNEYESVCVRDGNGDVLNGDVLTLILMSALENGTETETGTESAIVIEKRAPKQSAIESANVNENVNENVNVKGKGRAIENVSGCARALLILILTLFSFRVLISILLFLPFLTLVKAGKMKEGKALTRV